LNDDPERFHRRLAYVIAVLAAVLMILSLTLSLTR
jgi:uncharacterized membrane protein